MCACVNFVFVSCADLRKAQNFPPDKISHYTVRICKYIRCLCIPLASSLLLVTGSGVLDGEGLAETFLIGGSGVCVCVCVCVCVRRTVRIKVTQIKFTCWFMCMQHQGPPSSMWSSDCMQWGSVGFCAVYKLTLHRLSHHTLYWVELLLSLLSEVRATETTDGRLGRELLKWPATIWVRSRVGCKKLHVQWRTNKCGMKQMSQTLTQATHGQQ